MKRLGWLLIAIWAVFSIAALARFLADAPGDSTGEIRVRLAYELLTLNFPISNLVVFVAPAQPIWQWSLFTIAGFFQWVLLFPWLFRLGRQAYARFQAREGSERR